MRNPKNAPIPTIRMHWTVVIMLMVKNREKRIELRVTGAATSRERNPVSLSKRRGIPPAIEFPKIVSARIPGIMNAR